MHVRMFLLAMGLLAVGLVPRPGVAAPGRWVAGDLDLHSTFSADVCGTPPMPVTTNLTQTNCDPDGDGLAASPTNAGRTPIELVREAEQRHLEFIAITDLDVPENASAPSAQNDLEILAYKRCHVVTPAACPVLVLDGTEKSLTDTSGFTSGSLTVAAYSAPPPAGQQPNALGPFPADPTPADGWSTADLSSAIAQLHQPRADGTPGALVIADSPAAPAFGYDPVALQLDGWDVWNGTYLDQSELNGSAAADNPQADARWMTVQTQLAPSGRRLSLIGSSDARARAMDAVQGPGQPTLWAYDTIDDPDQPATWAGIRDAIVKGRVIISSAPPSDRGPLLFLETADGQYMSGDTLPTTATRQVRVIWQNAPLGAKIRFVGVLSSTGTVGAVPFTLTATTTDGIANGPSLQFTTGRWYRAEMFVEDALQPPAAGAPSRSTHGCVPVWPTPNPCLGDRWLMTSIAAPIFAPPAS